MSGDSNNSLQLTTGAVALAGALTLLAGAPEAAAAVPVKCYGISPAGENDCASKAFDHHCAGLSTVDYSGMEWQLVESKQACLEQHGKLHPFKGVNPYYAEQADGS